MEYLNHSSLITLGNLIGYSTLGYIGYRSFLYLKSKQLTKIDKASETESKLTETTKTTEKSLQSQIQTKVLGLALDAYCHLRWTQDQLANKFLQPKVEPISFVITRIWEIQGDVLDPVCLRIDPQKAQTLKIISFETLGLKPNPNIKYLIEYRSPSLGSESNPNQLYLIPCPGKMLVEGLDTRADWLFDNAGPEEFSEYKFNLKSNFDVDGTSAVKTLQNLNDLLKMYAGPLENFYQDSVFAVTGRNFFDLDGNRVLSYCESIELIDPILEEKIVLKL